MNLKRHETCFVNDIECLRGIFQKAENCPQWGTLSFEKCGPNFIFDNFCF